MRTTTRRTAHGFVFVPRQARQTRLTIASGSTKGTCARLPGEILRLYRSFRSVLHLAFTHNDVEGSSFEDTACEPQIVHLTMSLHTQTDYRNAVYHPAPFHCAVGTCAQVMRKLAAMCVKAHQQNARAAVKSMFAYMLGMWMDEAVSACAASPESRIAAGLRQQLQDSGLVWDMAAMMTNAADGLTAAAAATAGQQTASHSSWGSKNSSRNSSRDSSSSSSSGGGSSSSSSSSSSGSSSSSSSDAQDTADAFTCFEPGKQDSAGLPQILRGVVTVDSQVQLGGSSACSTCSCASDPDCLPNLQPNAAAGRHSGPASSSGGQQLAR
jgi:uncharacterized membrane protein YgcG